MFCYVSKVFTHAFTQGPLGMANILFTANCARDTANNVVRFTGAASEGVVTASGDGADDYQTRLVWNNDGSSVWFIYY